MGKIDDYDCLVKTTIVLAVQQWCCLLFNDGKDASICQLVDSMTQKNNTTGAGKVP